MQFLERRKAGKGGDDERDETARGEEVIRHKDMQLMHVKIRN